MFGINTLVQSIKDLTKSITIALDILDDTGGNIHEELVKVNTGLDDVASAIDDLTKFNRSQVPPGQVYLVTLNEGMNGMKGFKLVLPLATSKDTQFFEVVYQAGDSQPVTLHPANADYGKEPVTQGEIPNLVADAGTVVKGTVACVDDSGNKSPATPFEVVVLDQTAPPAPGEVGIVITDEAVSETE